MKQRIYSAFKHLALSVTLRGLSQRPRIAQIQAPEPRKRASDVNAAVADDAWMFDQDAHNAVEHRMDMLANEMDRLSGTLSGLRAFLGNVAQEAPMMAIANSIPNTPPMLADRDLFEGEPMVATPNAIPAAGEADYLFYEDVISEGQIESAQPQARAA